MREPGPVAVNSDQPLLHVIRVDGKMYLFFTLERVLVHALRNPWADILECVLAYTLGLGVGSLLVDVRGVEALEVCRETQDAASLGRERGLSNHAHGCTLPLNCGGFSRLTGEVATRTCLETGLPSQSHPNLPSSEV